MQALEFWKAVTVDNSGLLDRLLAWLQRHSVRFCVIGGQAVNAYVEPLVSLDLDLAVAAEDMESLEGLLGSEFTGARFPHRLNVSDSGSELRVQFQTDLRYAGFVDRAALRTVLGVTLPVAAIRDVLAGKIWAIQDSGRRPSKRLKDLADIARLLETYPELAADVPKDVLDRLV